MFGSPKKSSGWASLTDDEATPEELNSANAILALAKDSNAGVATAVMRGQKNNPQIGPDREIGRTALAKVNGRWVCHLTSSPNFDGKTDREIWLVEA